jgi:hypothetical protein
MNTKRGLTSEPPRHMPIDKMMINKVPERGMMTKEQSSRALNK